MTANVINKNGCARSSKNTAHPVTNTKEAIHMNVTQDVTGSHSRITRSTDKPQVLGQAIPMTTALGLAVPAVAGEVCPCGALAEIRIGANLDTAYCGDHDAAPDIHRSDPALAIALDEHMQQAREFLRRVPSDVIAEAFRRLDAEEPGQDWDRAAVSVEQFAAVTR